VNDYTIECWVNLSDPLSYGHIFNKTNISLWYQANIGRNYYGENSFILSVETEEGEFRWYVPDSYRSGVWQHLALTVSPDNEYVFYIDGIAQQWEVYLGTAAATKSNVKYPLCLGNRPSDLIRSAIGQIDELRIWNKCLNETAIRENSMTDYAANTTGLIAYYKFNEGSGESVYDYSINDNTALVSNADVSALGSDYFWDDVDQLISNYTIDNEKFISTYDAENKTYTLLIDDADLKALIASYDNPQHAVVSVNGSVQQSGVSINDFEDAPVSYIVDGIGFNEGVQQSFKVDIVNDLSSECELESFSFELNENPNLMAPLCLMENGDNFEQKVNRLLDISALKASFIASSGATVIINDEEQSSPQLLATDYSKSLLVKVVSENERFFKNYKVFIEAKNDEAELVSFSIAEQQVGESVFDSINNTVSLWTKNDADLSTLTAEFDVSDNATMYVKTINQRNGVTVNNFNSPVIYSVVSEDEINFVDWSVFVSIDDIKPEMTLIGDSIFTVTKGKAFIDQGATAIDNVDGDISVSIIVSGNLDTEVSDSYTLTYTANDEAGNSNTINRTVLVVDDTGTEEVFGIDVDIYASDKIVYVKVPDQIEGARLTIFNVTGSRVKEYSNLHSGLNFIPTELMSGVYLVAIEKNNQVYSGKVMIQ
jgi:hypothetical protein